MLRNVDCTRSSGSSQIGYVILEVVGKLSNRILLAARIDAHADELQTAIGVALVQRL